MSPAQARVAHAYTVERLTMEQIAKREGISKSAVKWRLDRAGVRREQGTRHDCICHQCGRTYQLLRSQFRGKKRMRFFCQWSCYAAHRRSPNYVESKVSQNRARRIVKAAGAPWVRGCCVHHHDRNQLNNAIENLAVFASNSDHIRYHHNLLIGRTDGPQPIWDGRHRAIG